MSPYRVPAAHQIGVKPPRAPLFKKIAWLCVGGALRLRARDVAKRDSWQAVTLVLGTKKVNQLLAWAVLNNLDSSYVTMRKQMARVACSPARRNRQCSACRCLPCRTGVCCLFLPHNSRSRE